VIKKRPEDHTTMNIRNLSDDEIKIIHECLRASAYGPFFIDNGAKDNPFWEIHSIFGLTMDELRKIADALPHIDMEKEDVRLAINNSINNLHGYPHNCTDEVWSSYISTSKKELYDIFVKWKGKNVKSYLDGME
jgi:hypothetical protein